MTRRTTMKARTRKITQRRLTRKALTLQLPSTPDLLPFYRPM
jgi:hypothetical protein